MGTPGGGVSGADSGPCAGLGWALRGGASGMRGFGGADSRGPGAGGVVGPSVWMVAP
ncbi:hypothetical protein [Nocardia sp.]|uniref:hypothetical protein n=1 Tax=Nocardia sp. TaxID=1821 RepID=UPI0026237470|nr:hypothetical protein [Nocardia sp.]